MGKILSISLDKLDDPIFDSPYGIFTPKNLSMALSVEASELLEIFQWQKADEYKRATEKQKEMIKDEIADIFYYLVRISEKLNINIEEALLNKMKKNKEKYPKESVKGKANG